MPRPKTDGQSAQAFVPPTFELAEVEPTAIATRLSAKEQASQSYFDALVRTAKTDKATIYRMPEAEVRSMTLKLSKALARCHLRDTFETGSGADATGTYAYLKPRKAKVTKPATATTAAAAS